MIKDQLLEIFDRHMSVFYDFYFSEHNLHLVTKASSAIVDCFKKNGKVFVCGNGGSASDSQHFVAELVGRFEKERKALNAIALTTNTSILTAIGNDYSFDDIFSRQVEANGTDQDILIGISTSGNSKNVIKAFDVANAKGMFTISLTGNDGGRLKEVSDLNLNIKSDNTATIQEVHITIIHAISKIVEDLSC
uniref:D-sedoheptulose-7-phosphate isomerase n=1 Tax=viral metagenome TaxID=1070528 RepID=A0A6M3KTB3_9ZZZZ